MSTEACDKDDGDFGLTNTDGNCVQIGFENELFSADNLDNDCVENIVIEEVLGQTNTNHINTIKNVFNNDLNVHLDFSNSNNVPSGICALTSFDTDANIASGNYSIFIIYSNEC